MRRKRNSFKYLLLTVLIIALGTCWYLYSDYQKNISTAVDPQDSAKISFIINKGDNAGKIGKNLHEKNLILNEGAFKLFIRLNNKDKEIVAGRFLWGDRRF